MYAVIATGGKQYRVAEGDSLRVERLDAEEGTEIELDRVLLVGDGDQVIIGRPFVEAGKVAATVKGHGRSRKIKVVKFKRRKNYLRRHGHRQNFTELEIKSITADQLAADQLAADQLAADQPDQLAADQPAVTNRWLTNRRLTNQRLTNQWLTNRRRTDRRLRHRPTR